jgi:hypothetical protein
LKSGPDVFADALVPIAEVGSGVRFSDIRSPASGPPDIGSPDTAPPTNTAIFRSLRGDAAFERNGYCFAKSEGKRIFPDCAASPVKQAITDSAAEVHGLFIYIPFIAILKLPFKFDRS